MDYCDIFIYRKGNFWSYQLLNIHKLVDYSMLLLYYDWKNESIAFIQTIEIFQKKVYIHSKKK